MKRKVFFSSIIDMWLCLRLGYPKIRCVVSLFSSFHCHLLVSKNTMFRQTKNLPSRKPTNSQSWPDLKEPIHTKCCYYVFTTPFTYIWYTYNKPNSEPNELIKLRYLGAKREGFLLMLAMDPSPWISRAKLWEDHQQTVRRILKLPSKSWGSRAPPCIMTIMNHVSNIFQQLIAIFHQLMAMD